ncbi:division/cell wall cluster transcriptional repressor MraZ [Asticcacaulis endophyticus]|uniref:division/cell wall cluster transcriptional repressor MraZ n=1 Tax=Asticcacaulis endophyticus TaxID=1395890 RepID=UPI00167ABBAD|nr:division/cell wall cluster transcriptional repressor MraZ [Asticcacaulis endophyticus]
MFLSHVEKQLDAKRRLLIPQDFRTTANSGSAGPKAATPDAFEGVYCFASIEADCLEGGGAEFFDRYRQLIESYAVGSPARRALEHKIYGGMHRLSFDAAGRITLPDSLCLKFGLSDKALIVGLYDRFQIWEPTAYAAYQAEQDQLAREVLSQRGA